MSETFSAKRCPIAAEFIRAFRSEFGDGVKVVRIEENGVKYPAQDQGKQENE